MRVQAQHMLKNPPRSLLISTAEELIDAAMLGGHNPEEDDHFEMIVVRTPSPRQSPLAEAAGIPMIPRG